MAAGLTEQTFCRPVPGALKVRVHISAHAVLIFLIMTLSELWWKQWDPSNVTIDANYVPNSWKTCVLQGVFYGEEIAGGTTAGRISSIFVIFITSIIVTLFPVVALHVPWLRIPRLLYVMAKNFGTGIILATAYIHLMDPAYDAIGRKSCVGSTGTWADYSWCPAIMLASSVLIFVVDVYCDFISLRYFENKSHVEILLDTKDEKKISHNKIEETGSLNVRKDFASQIYGFLILEFGVLFHSAMIGLTLGSTPDYVTLYIVMIFHQAFEGLGIGARLSLIPFPKKWSWAPYALCFAYAITTPLTIAIGIGLRAQYRDSDYSTLVVSGVLDAMSAGVMMYTAMVELIARDFVFKTPRFASLTDLNVQLLCMMSGIAIMSVLGRWV